MTATARVLGIPELFEAILLAPGSLKVRDLMRCREVCMAWRDGIDSSARVQRRMHLAPAPASPQPPVICDSLPTCTLHVEYSGDIDPLAGRAKEYDFLIIFDMHAMRMSDVDIAQLDKVLLFQPRCEFGLVSGMRGKAEGALLWALHSWMSAGVVVTLGAVVRLLQAVLTKHKAECIHHDISFSECEDGTVGLGGTMKLMERPTGEICSPITTNDIDKALEKPWKFDTHRCNGIWGDFTNCRMTRAAARARASPGF